mmetsp:Transcript_36245/g.42065  ORF Transcript_36245/g.42065 Transcript_36245/m.42065 type:complete len:86 (+) Transcript_36245:103-360(+)
MCFDWSTAENKSGCLDINFQRCGLFILVCCRNCFSDQQRASVTAPPGLSISIFSNEVGHDDNKMISSSAGLFNKGIRAEAFPPDT